MHSQNITNTSDNFLKVWNPTVATSQYLSLGVLMRGREGEAGRGTYGGLTRELAAAHEREYVLLLGGARSKELARGCHIAYK